MQRAEVRKNQVKFGHGFIKQQKHHPELEGVSAKAGVGAVALTSPFLHLLCAWQEPACHRNAPRAVQLQGAHLRFHAEKLVAVTEHRGHPEHHCSTSMSRGVFQRATDEVKVCMHSLQDGSKCQSQLSGVYSGFQVAVKKEGSSQRGLRALKCCSRL